MSYPSGTLRHVAIFTTPAGVTSSQPGHWIRLSSVLDHWGLIFQTKADFDDGDGLCIELDVGDGRIFPKRTSWKDRKQENGGKSKFQYSNTNRFTLWEDDRIENCARNICDEEMRGKYNVLDRNCQVMVNLLLTRILEGDRSDLGRTLGHSFSRKSTFNRLFASSDFDHGLGSKLALTKIQQEPRWDIGDNISRQLTEAAQARSSDFTSDPTAQIDLSGAIRPDGPLNLDEVRQNAYFWAQPPPVYTPRSTTSRDIEPSQIDAFWAKLAAQPPFPPTPQDVIDEARQKIGPISQEADKASLVFRSYLTQYYKKLVSDVRETATRTAAISPYLDPNVQSHVRDDKVRRLHALNSNAMRQTRAEAMRQMKERTERGEGWLGKRRAMGFALPAQDSDLVPRKECTECMAINPNCRPGLVCFDCFCEAQDEKVDSSTTVAGAELAH